jgi:hypothetical protein
VYQLPTPAQPPYQSLAQFTGDLAGATLLFDTSVETGDGGKTPLVELNGSSTSSDNIVWDYGSGTGFIDYITVLGTTVFTRANEWLVNSFTFPTGNPQVITNKSNATILGTIQVVPVNTTPVDCEYLSNNPATTLPTLTVNGDIATNTLTSTGTISTTAISDSSISTKGGIRAVSRVEITGAKMPGVDDAVGGILEVSAGQSGSGTGWGANAYIRGGWNGAYLLVGGGYGPEEDAKPTIVLGNDAIQSWADVANYLPGSHTITPHQHHRLHAPDHWMLL